MSQAAALSGICVCRGFSNSHKTAVNSERKKKHCRMKNHRFGLNCRIRCHSNSQSANSLICYYVFLVKQPLPCFGVRVAYICWLTLFDLINSISNHFLIVSILKLCFCSKSSLVKMAPSYKGSRNMYTSFIKYDRSRRRLFFRRGIWQTNPTIR